MASGRTSTNQKTQRAGTRPAGKRYTGSTSRAQSTTQKASTPKRARTTQPRTVREKRGFCGCRGCLITLLILILFTFGALFVYTKYTEERTPVVAPATYDTTSNIEHFNTYVATNPSFDDFASYFYTIRPATDQQVIWDTDGLLQHTEVSWEAVYLRSEEGGLRLLGTRHYASTIDLGAEPELINTLMPFTILLTGETGVGEIAQGQRITFSGTLIGRGSTDELAPSGWTVEADHVEVGGQIGA